MTASSVLHTGLSDHLTVHASDVCASALPKISMHSKYLRDGQQILKERTYCVSSLAGVAQSAMSERLWLRQSCHRLSRASKAMQFPDRKHLVTLPVLKHVPLSPM